MGVFQKATKKKSKLRLMVASASGGGKTTAALRIATSVAKHVGGRIALIDSESGSASLYSDEFDFDVLDMENTFSPEDYIQAIKMAEEAGYETIVLDGITPEWSGPGGCLDIQTRLGGRYTDWAKVTPRHNAFIQAILTSPAHIITTCRSKTQHEMDAATKKVTKQGTAPVQRDGIDYEMTVVFDLNQHHIASVSKDRTKLFDGKDFEITEDTGNLLMEWLNSGADVNPLDVELKELFGKIGYGMAQQMAANKKYPDKQVLINKIKEKLSTSSDGDGS